MTYTVQYTVYIHLPKKSLKISRRVFLFCSASNNAHSIWNTLTGVTLGISRRICIYTHIESYMISTSMCVVYVASIMYKHVTAVQLVYKTKQHLHVGGNRSRSPLPRYPLVAYSTITSPSPLQTPHYPPSAHYHCHHHLRFRTA